MPRRQLRNPRPRHYVKVPRHHGPAIGHSLIAPTFWQEAEHIRRRITEECPDGHASLVIAICLYHAAIECYMNERLGWVITSVSQPAYRQEQAKSIQDETLSPFKIHEFLKFFRCRSKFDQKIITKLISLIGLRNKIYHHSPVMQDISFFPKEVRKALRAAGVELRGGTWMSECSSPRLAQWASEIVPNFIDEFGRATRLGCSHFDLPGWGRNPPFEFRPFPLTR